MKKGCTLIRVSKSKFAISVTYSQGISKKWGFEVDFCNKWGGEVKFLIFRLFMGVLLGKLGFEDLKVSVISMVGQGDFLTF